MTDVRKEKFRGKDKSKDIPSKASKNGCPSLSVPGAYVLAPFQ
jgi:hypothetical protein